VAAITLVVGVAWAQTRIDPNGVNVSGSVIGDDVLYSIGGGRAVSMGGAGNMQSIGVGVGWNSNLICGDMSITTTLQNQLNGITNGFQTIMSNVIQNATSAVASLPALIIQRADPGLYNLLTNGILQARLDFDRSKMTCRAIANRMADMAGGQAGWDQLAEGMALRDAVSSTDAVSAIEQAESNKGTTACPGSAAATRAAPARFDQGGRRRDARGLQPAQRAQRHRYLVDRAQRLRQPPDLPDLVVARGRGLCEPRAGRTRATHLRKLHEDPDHAWRRADASDPGRVRDQAAGVAGTGDGRPADDAGQSRRGRQQLAADHPRRDRGPA
jgi:hypothetical protein